MRGELKSTRGQQQARPWGARGPPQGKRHAVHWAAVRPPELWLHLASTPPSQCCFLRASCALGVSCMNLLGFRNLQGCEQLRRLARLLPPTTRVLSSSWGGGFLSTHSAPTQLGRATGKWVIDSRAQWTLCRSCFALFCFVFSFHWGWQRPQRMFSGGSSAACVAVTASARNASLLPALSIALSSCSWSQPACCFRTCLGRCGVQTLCENPNRLTLQDRISQSVCPGMFFRILEKEPHGFKGIKKGEVACHTCLERS